MPSRSSKGLQMIKSLKKSISKKVNLFESPRSNSKPYFLVNLKRAIQSTPDLLKSPGEHQSCPLNNSVFDKQLPLSSSDQEFSSDFHSDQCSLEPIFTPALSELSSSSKEQQINKVSGPKFTKTKVLFCPPKPSPVFGFLPSSRSVFGFGLRKTKSASEFQPVLKPAGNVHRPWNLPTITLSEPDDDDIYLLSRPTPLLSLSGHLQVLTRTSSEKRKHHIATTQELSPKRWPHPSGPWLRCSEEDIGRINREEELVFGFRLGDGRLLGMSMNHLEKIGIDIPPRLPTEEELQTLALVEQISMSLDRAQDALYDAFDQNRWDDDWDEEDEEDVEDEDKQAISDSYWNRRKAQSVFHAFGEDEEQDMIEILE